MSDFDGSLKSTHIHVFQIQIKQWVMNRNVAGSQDFPAHSAVIIESLLLYVSQKSIRPIE